jgi:hypothetical protein
MAGFMLLATASIFVFPARGAGPGGLQGRIAHYGGVVRLGPDWGLHNDGGHQPIGIQGMRLVNGCDLRISFTSPKGSQIVSAVATADAQLATMGVIPGMYGASQSATVELHHEVDPRVWPASGSSDKLCADAQVFAGRHADVWLSVNVLLP